MSGSNWYIVSRTRWYIIGASAVVGAAVLAAAFLRYERPPAGALRDARAALDSAAASGASAYSPESYRWAESLLAEGWVEMRRQDGRLRPLRDYAAADSLLRRSLAQSFLAAAQARDSVRYLDSLAYSEFAVLEEELGYYRAVLDGNLKNAAVERLWSLGETRLAAAQALVERGEYADALVMLGLARESLNKAGDMLSEYLEDEDRLTAIWAAWTRETLEESRRSGAAAVIVDKSAHKAYLVQAGKVVHSYECELGRRPGVQKRHAGDAATPEGRYRVVKTKPRGSKYHKAILIDYPNRDDRERFSEGLVNGALPAGARIGGNIEIHGEGGKGRDWTDGCVALANEDMDHLMRFVKVGTPVTIVRRSGITP